MTLAPPTPAGPVRADLRRVVLELHRPLVSAHGTVGERELLRLEITDGDGVTGVGEAAPLESYDGVPLDVCGSALADAAAVLRRGGTGVEAMHAAVLPQAAAAVDLALWDLAGRRAGEPVWRLLGAAVTPAVEVNATLGAEDRSGAAEQAATARAAGFGCLKVKAGIGDDHGRLAAVRAFAGPDVAIRIDANGAWTVEEAVTALRGLEPLGLELCEEPVHGLAGLAAVREQSPTLIALDETAGAPGALTAGAADAVCLKLSRHGGISGTVAAALSARTAGLDVYLASTLDSEIGIAAALHAATVIRPDRASGLATLDLFRKPVIDELTPTRGMLRVPGGPGLGVSP